MDFLSPNLTITRWIITPIKPPKVEWNYPAQEKVIQATGSRQGILALVGTSFGPGWINHSWSNCSDIRLDRSMPHGGSFWPSHLESLSAKSLLWPAMCDVSTSMPVEEIKMLSFSVKSARGIVVVKRLLAMLSAADLSESVGILIGMRKPGWKRVATKTRAI